MQIGIIGAGMAGLSCAEVLVQAEHGVTLFDKARGPGGRMATRRMETVQGEAAFDHGAQYFTVREEAFADVVGGWERTGHAARWPAAGPEAWVGVPGMNSVIRKMADRLDVQFGALVTGMDASRQGWTIHMGPGRAGPFDALILAIPAEQAATLLSLHDFELARVALRARSQPCWTCMFAFADRLDSPDAPIRDCGDISWAVRNRDKPGRSGPESWVVQAQPQWTHAHLEKPADEVSGLLLGLLGSALGKQLPDPIGAAAHRWRFAMSSGTGDEALWNEHTLLGACGDWLIGPRVECAWLSGRAMADKVLASHGGADG